MQARTVLAAAVIAAATLTAVSGCAVSRGQSTVGEYLDDTGITTKVKARFVENKIVDAAAISVETLNGTVMLSGFAKSEAEKKKAEDLARASSGVKDVKNQIVVRP